MASNAPKKNVLSTKDVKKIAQRRFNDDKEVIVESFEINPFSLETIGLLGSHHSLRIDILKKETNEKDTALFFVKSIPHDFKERAIYIINEEVFLKESQFYDKISTALYEKYTGERWSPVAYMIKKDVIVMEDLIAQGYRMHNLWVDSMPEMKSALLAVARMHGCSILAEAKLSRKAQTVTTLLDKFPSAFKETAHSSEAGNHKFVERSIKVAAELCHMYELGDPYILRNGLMRLETLVLPSTKHRNVLCHGELWWTNMLFDSAQPQPNCRLLDFQMMRYAPQALDVLQLIYMNATRDWREAFEPELLEYYYEHLAETVRAGGLEDAILPTLDEFTGAVEDLRLYGVTVACVYLPFALMDKKILENSLADDDLYLEYSAKATTELTAQYLQSNPEAINRIQEILAEAFEYVELVFSIEMDEYLIGDFELTGEDESIVV